MKAIAVIFFLFACICLQAQVFVKADATGLNNGSSWANAYTDLQTAIDNSAGNQLWIATGTWYPANPGDPETATFSISDNIQLYGGFAGTESSFFERDIIANPAILSGDLNDDDVLNDFEINRSDNVQHILSIGGNITNLTIIDGFTFISGHADGSSFPDNRGAGIFNEGLPVIRNCSFHQNYANRGAGLNINLSIVNPTDTLQLDSCLFSNNLSTVSGSGLFLEIHAANHCFIMENTQFESNYGRAVVNVMREDSCSAIIHNCLFDSTETSGSGAGGAMLIRSDADACSYQVSDCAFVNNSTNGIGGGLWCVFNPNSTNSVMSIENCNFNNNSSNINGAALGARFQNMNNELEISQCSFENNILEGTAAENYGAAIYAENFTSGTNGVLRIQNCFFNENISQYAGGAIDIFDEGTGFNAQILASRFSSNDALQFGQAISAESNSMDGKLKVENCLFFDHNNDLSSVFVNIGTFQTKLLNCTFASNNFVVVSQESNQALEIQNCIFYNPNAFSVVAFTEITSLGGNVLTDDSMTDFFTASDQQVVDPLFIGSGTYPFQLSENSPAVNSGVLTGEEAEFDLAGEVRVQNDCIDSGAYESPFGPDCALVGLEEVLANKSIVHIFPNPVDRNTTVTLANDWYGELQIELLNVLGQKIHASNLLKESETVHQTLNLKSLEKGIYVLTFSNGKKTLAQKLIKQ